MFLKRSTVVVSFLLGVAVHFLWMVVGALLGLYFTWAPWFRLYDIAIHITDPMWYTGWHFGVWLFNGLLYVMTAFLYGRFVHRS